nr:hypothetical protein GCM10020093_049130 [Planobispora longispora]
MAARRDARLRPRTARRRFPAADARRKKIVIGSAVAALVAAALGVGGYLALTSGGPPTDLTLLYQDDFTQSSDWPGSKYDGETIKYGPAPEGYYAIDVVGDDRVRRVTAPVPFLTDPSPTPVPTPPPRSAPPRHPGAAPPRRGRRRPRRRLRRR